MPNDHEATGHRDHDHDGHDRGAHDHAGGHHSEGHDHEGHDHDEPGHAHGHGLHAHPHHAPLTSEGSNARLALALSLNLVFVVLESGFGFLANSVALIADAGHNLGDALGLGFAWAALHLARRPPGGRFTYGLGRSSVLAALTNAVLLLVACGAIAWEAIGRIAAAPAVAGSTVAGVAASGIVLNGLSAWLLHRGSEHDLNRRSAFLHMLADAAVSAGVLLSGLVIAATGWRWLDPLVSLLIVVIILIGTFGLLRDAVQLSLDAVPARINTSAVLAYLAGQRGVTDVHDLHIWALSTTSVALTAHLVVPEVEAADALLNELTPSLKRRFRIDHATLQIERDRCAHGC